MQPIRGTLKTKTYSVTFNIAEAIKDERRVRGRIDRCEKKRKEKKRDRDREERVRSVRIPMEESSYAREEKAAPLRETQRSKTFERLTHFSIVSAEPMAHAPVGTAEPILLIAE